MNVLLPASPRLRVKHLTLFYSSSAFSWEHGHASRKARPRPRTSARGSWPGLNIGSMVWFGWTLGYRAHCAGRSSVWTP